MNVLLGKITDEEKKRAQLISLEKGALRELLVTLPISQDETAPIYKKIKEDYIRASAELNSWWAQVTTKYKWSYTQDDKWFLNGETNEVVLQTQPSVMNSPDI